MRPFDSFLTFFSDQWTKVGVRIKKSWFDVLKSTKFLYPLREISNALPSQLIFDLYFFFMSEQKVGFQFGAKIWVFEVQNKLLPKRTGESNSMGSIWFMFKIIFLHKSFERLSFKLDKYNFLISEHPLYQSSLILLKNL